MVESVELERLVVYICEFFRLTLGLYNCCGGVGAKKLGDLAMTAREQIMFQNGAIASANC